MTYGEMIAGIRSELWPDGGEAENLIKLHDNFFQQALYDIIVAVQCYQLNQNDRFAHCSTFFNCGLTVIPKPAGAIVRVYTIDRINPDTGKEDPTAQEEWCSKVNYYPVDFDSISRYVKLCERCGSSPGAADEIAAMFWGVYRPKRRYPRPTDEGLTQRPKLPEGYHYPQASTDAAGRSPRGVYALYRGRLYLAPWIQSTETAVVEWRGVKRKWSADDIVEDDPKFWQAVSLHVLHQHESRWGDPAKAADYYNQLRGPIGAIPVLVHQCREESTSHRPTEPGFGSERGMGTPSGAGALFTNDTKAAYTARCPTGQTGTPVTVTKEVGSVSSPFSVADANARAMAAAQEDATAQLSCETPPVTYLNVEQPYTAECPGADEATGRPAAVGTSVTVVVAAGKYSSTESQTAADDAAKAAAKADADSQLVCTFANRAVSVTASCPTGQAGDDVTKDVAASQFTSQESQDTADELAKAEAQRQANAELVCSGSTVLISNTPQSGSYTAFCRCNHSAPRDLTGTANISAGVYTITVDNTPAAIATGQQVVNGQAFAAAQNLAYQRWANMCIHC